MTAPPRELIPSVELARRLVGPAFARVPVLAVEPVASGLRNHHFELRLEGRSLPVVLRVYREDPSVCRKEVSLLGRVREAVPVPDVLHAEPAGIEGFGPYVLLDFVEGVSLGALKESGNVAALRQAAPSVGAALAAIGRYEFSSPGRLGDDLEPAGPFVEGPDPIVTFVDSCLAKPSFLARVGPARAERIHDFVGSWRERLASLDDERRLVHGDFNASNLLVREIDGEWKLVAVLDWEFGFAGSPLFDVGNFLRYERADPPVFEPGFSRSFVEHGGRLPHDWKRLARVIDLTSQCEMLAREELRGHVAGDLIELIELTLAILEDRDPPF